LVALAYSTTNVGFYLFTLYSYSLFSGYNSLAPYLSTLKAAITFKILAIGLKTLLDSSMEQVQFTRKFLIFCIQNSNVVAGFRQRIGKIQLILN
jgi:hypothetical protein